MSVAQALTADSSASKEAAASATTRLHITPFNPTLLKTYIPPSVLPSATGISYHATQTFPEKGFGYVEIPTMDAQKLKKKFNGSILKGVKVRIEDARPEKRKRVLENQIDDAAEEKTEKSGKRLKKPKRTEKLVTGFELPDERHVKRGWTEPDVHSKHKDAKTKDKKDKKDKKRKAEPSKFTKEPELLFRATLPPTAATTVSLKSGKNKSKSKQGKTSRDIVVHEFEKTTKHATFLKGSQISKDAKPAVEFVEEKGWVDADGNVVEPEPEQRQKRREARKAAKLRDAVQKDDAPSTETRKRIERSEAGKSELPPACASEGGDEDESDDSSVVSTSSSDVSSSGEGVSEAVSSSDAASVVGEEADEIDDAASGASSSEQSEDEVFSSAESATDESQDAASEGPKEVHPLEALFKRPKAPEQGSPSAKLAPINTSFSFFDAEAEDDDLGELPVQTPHTFQDRQVRGIRSAAPTPDTAAIGKRFLPPWRDEDEDEDEDSRMAEASTAPVSTNADAEKEELPQSDFAKHFWEKRGDYNRAWKKRRRDSMKQKRQRDNRKVGRRVV